MISTNSLFTQTDIDTQRRQALAKVYALLIRLAEEREKQKALSETAKLEEVEVSVPLKNNIPS
jgi:hypothetical protein